MVVVIVLNAPCLHLRIFGQIIPAWLLLSNVFMERQDHRRTPIPERRLFSLAKTFVLCNSIPEHQSGPSGVDQ